MTAASPSPIFTEMQRAYVRQHPRRTPANPNGAPMPPVASAQAAIEHAAARLAEIASSRLVVALADEGLGAYLTDADIGHVCAIVRSLEAPRRRPELPQRADEANGAGLDEVPA